MVWDPEQYLVFEAPRLRPALDLLARIPDVASDVVVDLGCGTGHLTRRLAERWPDARVLGVDRSAEMLAEARATDVTGIEWVEADLANWEPDGPVEVVWSNSTLHWLGDHESLFPRIVSWLRPEGVLAVQMPRNFPEPSHTCAFDAAREGPWADRLVPLLRPDPVAPPTELYDLLDGHVGALDVWETVYVHRLEGEDPVLEWTSGSLLRPLLAELDPDEEEAFRRVYAECLRAAYPPRDDGTTLFPFRRQFVVARR